MTKKQLITWLTAAYVALLTTLCLVPVPMELPDIPTIGFDKLVHLGIYFGLIILLSANVIARRANATKKQFPAPMPSATPKQIAPPKQIVATTLAAIAYGIAIEFTQAQVGRSFDPYDIVANSLGAISAALLVIFCPQVRKLLMRLLDYLPQRY